MTRIAFGIVIGSVLYATATLLAFRPAGADDVFRKRSVQACSCREVAL